MTVSCKETNLPLFYGMIPHQHVELLLQVSPVVLNLLNAATH